MASELSVEFCAVDAEGNDVTDEYYVVIEDYATGGDYVALTITKRVIVIHSKTQSKPYDGEPLECKEYYVFEGSFAEGHTNNLEEIINGYLPGEVGSDYNFITVSDFIIWDRDGNEVQNNYDYTLIPGRLTIT